ncbi:zinc finger, CCHC-type containing protein [Tanacetum coccineum]
MSEDKNKEIIIHKEVTSFSQFQCPILKSTNYTVWALRIKTILRANGLWEIIEREDNAQLDIKKDMATTAYLYQALPEDMILQVASCNSAKEIWEALQTRHIGVDRVQKAQLQTLKTEFEMLKMKKDDSIDEFSAKLNSIIVAAIEQFTNLEETTLDEIIGFKNGGQEKFRSYQDNKQDGKTKQFNNEKKPSHKFKRNNFQKGTKDLSKVECYNCNKFGHVRRNCKLKDKGQEQSNLVQEDVEPTLLMAVQGKGDKAEEIFLNEKEIEPKRYISTDESLWYLDNGASNHMTGVRTHFKEIDEKISGRVRFGDGSYVEIKGRGSILLECKNKEQRIIPNVYYIPNLKSNILSLGQLTENGCKIIMQNNLLLLHGQDQKLLMRVERSRNRLYKINLKVGMPMCLLANLENHAWLWHARLGHLNFDSIKQMTQKKLVEGIPSISHKNQVCNACLLGKHSRAPFPNQTNTKSLEPLNLIFGDLCGPISPATESGKKYMFLLVDDCTRYMWVYFLKSKDEAFETFKEFKLKVENEVGKKLRSFRTDRGGEFTSREFTRSKAYRLFDPVTKDIIQFIKAFDHTPVQGYRNLSEIYDRAPEVQSDELLLLEEEPRNYKEVAQDKKWIEAMQIEIDSINKNKTWKLATHQTIRRLLVLMDYDEVFAPVARMETVRLILAISAYHGWEVYHLDVKSAFLHGELKKKLLHNQMVFKKPEIK